MESVRFAPNRFAQLQASLTRKCDIDRFASDSNALLPCFNSFMPNNAGQAIDAFA